jgi:hypothetical protein
VNRTKVRKEDKRMCRGARRENVVSDFTGIAVPGASTSSGRIRHSWEPHLTLREAWGKSLSASALPCGE